MPFAHSGFMDWVKANHLETPSSWQRHVVYVYCFRNSIIPATVGIDHSVRTCIRGGAHQPSCWCCWIASRNTTCSSSPLRGWQVTPGKAPANNIARSSQTFKNQQGRNAFCIRRRIPAKMLKAYFNKEFLCSKKFSENLTGVQTLAITTALGISPRPWKKRTLKSGDSRKWFCGARNAEQSFVIQGGKTWKKSILVKF